MSVHRIKAVAAASLLAASAAAFAPVPTPSDLQVGDGRVVAATRFTGATEIDFDGRYAYVGQTNGKYNRTNVAPGQQGGLRVFDLVGDDTTAQFTEVGALACPGTDNYVRTLDPEVFEGDFVLMAHHGNLCTKEIIQFDPASEKSSGYGALNGLALVDVSDPTRPRIVDAVGHSSAHTAMPHPTRPYIFVLPGGLANGTRTSGNRQVSPTAIVDASNPADLRVVTSFQHNVSGCHDLGFTTDGDYAYCAGLGEIQVWDLRGERITQPAVVGTIVNPAIQFAHNAVVSPDGTKLVINDEAFGFHTCQGEAVDLYGSLWVYDITVPTVPVLAGRISPPQSDTGPGTYAGWTQSWCAAHNYNFVPGTDIVVSSWFAGGMTAHDISDPMRPELLAAYRPDEESVMYSAHYYGGYVTIADMARGFEVLDIPALREAEAAGTTAEATARAATDASVPARIDRTAELLPTVLPARPARPEWQPGGICVLPGRF